MAKRVIAIDNQNRRVEIFVYELPDFTAVGPVADTPVKTGAEGYIDPSLLGPVETIMNYSEKFDIGPGGTDEHILPAVPAGKIFRMKRAKVSSALPIDIKAYVDSDFLEADFNMERGSAKIDPSDYYEILEGEVFKVVIENRSDTETATFYSVISGAFIDV